MKVYVLMHTTEDCMVVSTDYLGVFSSEEKAQEMFESLTEDDKEDGSDSDCRSEYWQILEREVDLA